MRKRLRKAHMRTDVSLLHWPLSYYKTSPLLQPSENSFETVRGLRVPARHCAGVGLLATSMLGVEAAAWLG